MSDVTGRTTARMTQGGGEARPLLDAEFLRTLEVLTTAAPPLPGRARPPRRATRRGETSDLDPADAAPPRQRSQSAGRAGMPEPHPGPATSSHDLEVAALSHLFQGTLVLPHDLSLHILLDGSQSMLLPKSDKPDVASKFQYARRLAAALGYAALVRYERVSVTCFASSVGRRTPAFRGQAGGRLLLDYLQSIRAGGEGFARVLEHYATRNARPGVCVVISDFLDPQWEKGIRALLSRRFQIILLQVLSASEISPPVGDDLRLVDAATGQARDMVPGTVVSTHYQDALNRFFEMLSEAAGRNGMGYLRITTSTDFAEPLLTTLRRAQSSRQD